MSIEDQAFDEIIAGSPRQSAERTLNVLMGHVRAVSGGLFVARDRPELFVGRIDQAGLDRVGDAWQKHRAQLESGHPLFTALYCCCPLRGEGPALALLYLTLPSSPDQVRLREQVLECVAALSPLLLKAVALQGRANSEGAPTIEAFLEQTSSTDLARQKLRLLLDRHEWNLSRVARALGVTRVTIYKRMQRYGIERLKVQKT